MSEAVAASRPREPWGRFFGKVALVLLPLFSAFSYIGDRFIVAIDSQAISCLPNTRILVIDKKDHEPRRGAIFAYRSVGLAPVWKDGTLLAKIMDAVPGDAIDVSANGVKVNDALVSEGLPLTKFLHHDDAYYTRHETLGVDQYLMLGRSAVSYDGRYWGTISADQIVGRAYRIM